MGHSARRLVLLGVATIALLALIAPALHAIPVLLPSSLRDARSLTRLQARLLPGSAEDAAHGVGVGIAVCAVGDQGAALANLIPGIDEHDALAHRPLGMGIDPLTRRSGIAGKCGRGAARVEEGRLLLTGGEALVPVQRDHRDVRLWQGG